MPRYKLQVQEDEMRPELWCDVKNEFGVLYTFDKELDARQKLAELFPVLVKMEQFQADRKRTRVLVVSPYVDIDKEKED